MIQVAVIGTRTLGKILIQILRKHPKATIVYTANSQESSGNLANADCVFLALPHGQSHIFIAKNQSLLKGRKIIDSGDDFRLKWVYGLPEFNRPAIKTAMQIACPGCYATSVLLGLGPLIGKLSTTAIDIAATSGISGAGLKKRAKDNFFSYKTGQIHEHLPEIKMISGTTDIIFAPLRCDNTNFGIVSSIFIHGLKKERNIANLYRRFYDCEPCVRIVNHDIQTADIIGTAYCDIHVQWPNQNTLLIISALDNTLKGGASQAIQNFNLMFGFNEFMGLEKYLKNRP